MRGNKNIKDYSPMIDNSIIDKELNTKLVSNILESFHATIPDLHDSKQVEQAITGYFERCIDKGLRPGNLGLYNALGLSKTEVSDLLLGRNPNKASLESIRLIKNAKKSLAEYRELLGSMNEIAVPTLIFWQKNYDGLEDIQRVDVAPVNTLTADRTPEEIAADIPVDDD